MASGLLAVTLHQQRVFEGSLEQLAPLREFVQQVLAAFGGNELDIFAFELACDEAAANVFKHAYESKPGRLVVELLGNPESVVVRMHYHGKAFDPSRVPSPEIDAPLEQRPVGGLGLYFMRQVMDEVHFEFDPAHGNTLTMRRRLNVPERYGFMELQVERPKPDVAVIHVQGSVDGSNFKRLIGEADKLYADGVRKVIAELSNCEYMSSSGLIALNAITKLLRGEGTPETDDGWTLLKTLDDARTKAGKQPLALASPTPRVDRVLDMAGMKTYLPIYPDVPSALAGLA